MPIDGAIYPRQLTGRKIYFSSCVEISVNGWLHQLVLGLWRDSTVWKGVQWWNTDGNLMVARDKKRVWCPNIPFKNMYPMSNLPFTRPHLLNVSTSPNNRTGGAQTINIWPLEDI
jgi:hypothetical protein